MIPDSTLPTRSDLRSHIDSAVPNEQVSPVTLIDLQEELWRRMRSLEHVRTGPSGISGDSERALSLDPGHAAGPAEAFLHGSEFAHLHRAEDNSLHATLPHAVAEQAIARGWAELHPLARMGRVPSTFVLLFWPRDASELETVWRLVKTSYAFARGAGARADDTSGPGS